MRKLISIPTVHEIEYSHRHAKELYSNEFVISDEDRLVVDEEIKKTWSLIRRGVLRLPKDLSGVRLFIEGTTKHEESRLEEIRSFFPGSSPEKLMNPTKELAELLGWQDRLRIYLLLRGASQEITEGPHYNEHFIILDEIAGIRKQITSRAIDWVKAKKSADPEYINGFRTSIEDLAQNIKLLEEREVHVKEQRDKDIAANINKRLKENETGILILGGGHNPSKWLDRDIEVEFIDPELGEIIKEHRREFEASRRSLENSGSKGSESKG